MLDRIQSLSISDGRTSVYDRIGLKADDREIYVPPTTHLVATIDDLADVLDNDEATDMDEDVDGPTENTPPLINTGKWTTTSTYDVYMVDTPRNPSGPHLRCGQGTKGTPAGTTPPPITAARQPARLTT